MKLYGQWDIPTNEKLMNEPLNNYKKFVKTVFLQVSYKNILQQAVSPALI